MAGRLRVLKARPGRIVRGRFVANKGRRNIAAGFHDEEGQFHPIRASYDYDPGRAGESGRKRKAKAKKKKKPARKKAKARPVKKTKARKRR